MCKCLKGQLFQDPGAEIKMEIYILPFLKEESVNHDIMGLIFLLIT
jgi:hypothetical protein